ncbi:MAG: DUF1697 domain-containing protein [Marinilabiliales bacterium]|nr:DUF1697 domain-containing protein [Marinilabiliales bacterium]
MPENRSVPTPSTHPQTQVIALLRSINVGGRNPVRMEALRESFSELGCRKVTSYIQSGNILFQTDGFDRIEWMNRIESALLQRFGFPIPVVLLDKSELKDLLDLPPSFQKAGMDPKHLYVTLFSEPVATKFPVEQLTAKKEQEEVFQTERALYLYCPDGYGKTRLTNDYLEKKLKVRATTRNWNTLTTLAEMADQMTE